MTAISDTKPTTAAPTSPQLFLTFTLNGEVFALDIVRVTEILELRHITEVPMMPAFIRGVINLRGRVVPVIDLAMRFQRGQTTLARRTGIVIIQLLNPADGTTQDVGILVDTVNEVIPLEAADIEPPPNFGAGIKADYLHGMARRDDDFVLLLDADKVLNTATLAAIGGGGSSSEAPR